MLFAKLACFTYSLNPLLSEGEESNDDSFRQHSLELLEIDVVDSLVPQFYVCVDFGSFRIHCLVHFIRTKDEHSIFSSSSRDESAPLFNQATSVVERDLYALLHDLADLDQIFRYGWYMQDILNGGFVTFFS